MLSQTLRTRQNTFACRLHIHRHFNHASTSSEDDHHHKDRTALIRTREPFNSLADTWTLLRAVERRYGKVVEARFLKDNKANNRYGTFTYVIFLHKESLRRIPKAGQKFCIPALVTEDQPGGLGLDDIEYLLDSTDRDETFEFPSSASREVRESKRIISAQIERTSKGVYTYPKGYKPSIPEADMSFAEQFLRWGGFHELKPLNSWGDLKEIVWLENPQMRMRAALQRCARLTGLADPAIFRPTKAQKDDGKVSDSSPGSVPDKSPEEPLQPARFTNIIAKIWKRLSGR